jgi:hypothetical protein
VKTFFREAGKIEDKAIDVRVEIQRGGVSIMMNGYYVMDFGFDEDGKIVASKIGALDGEIFKIEGPCETLVVEGSK